MVFHGECMSYIVSYISLDLYMAKHSVACVENKWLGEMKGKSVRIVFLIRLFRYMSCISW